MVGMQRPREVSEPWGWTWSIQPSGSCWQKMDLACTPAFLPSSKLLAASSYELLRSEELPQGRCPMGGPEPHGALVTAVCLLCIWDLLKCIKTLRPPEAESCCCEYWLFPPQYNPIRNPNIKDEKSDLDLQTSPSSSPEHQHRTESLVKHKMSYWGARWTLSIETQWYCPGEDTGEEPDTDLPLGSSLPRDWL